MKGLSWVLVDSGGVCGKAQTTISTLKSFHTVSIRQSQFIEPGPPAPLWANTEIHPVMMEQLKKTDRTKKKE